MKRVVLYIILGFSFLSANSQTYHKLIRPNVYWDVASYSGTLFCYYGIIRTEFVEGDTLIEGHYYRFANDYGFIGVPAPDGSICPPYVVDTIPYKYAILREDTIERKVFIYSEDYIPHDQLLYDFSLNTGDTLFSQYAGLGSYFVIDTVKDTILENGEIRKVFCLDPSCWMNYIESIGGWQGLSNPLVMGLGFGWDLLCVKENDDNLWGNSCNYYFVGIKEGYNKKVEMFPNPTTDQITIQCPTTSSPFSLTILNSFGQVKHNQLSKDNSIKISLSHLPSGIYLAIIKNSKIFERQKIIKL